MEFSLQTIMTIMKKNIEIKFLSLGMTRNFVNFLCKQCYFTHKKCII